MVLTGHSGMSITNKLRLHNVSGELSKTHENESSHLRNMTRTARPDSCNSCFKRTFQFTVTSPNICKGTNSSSIDLLILIFTTHANQENRNAIRMSWASLSMNNTSPNFRYVFLFGYSNSKSEKKLMDENSIYQDMALQTFKDTYRNLTLKTMMGFEWYAQFCNQAKFIMKTDNDVYVNVTNILRLIKRPDLKKKVFGNCVYIKRTVRGRSKWSATRWEYPNKTYPGFCSGTAYIMSAEIANNLRRISPHIPFFFLEDIYVSLCVHKLGYKLQNIIGFNVGRVPFRNGKCELYGRENTYSSHRVPPKYMLAIWKSCMDVSSSP